jgi:hypothetical protein
VHSLVHRAPAGLSAHNCSSGCECHVTTSGFDRIKSHGALPLRNSSAHRAGAQQIQASGRANCSPLNPETKRPPRISPCASLRRSTGSRSRHGGASFRAPADRGTARPNAPAVDRRRLQRARRLRRRLPGAAQRPTSSGMRGRASLPRPSPRRRLGSTSDRRFSKPSAVTNPAATSSHSPSSTSLASRPVARTKSAKNDAPRCSICASTSRRMRKRRSLRLGSGAASQSAHPRAERSRWARFAWAARGAVPALQRPDAATGAPTSLRPTGTARSRNSGS